MALPACRALVVLALGGLTASAGVASYPADATDLETLIHAADDALLICKRTGRNRTTAATTGANGSAADA